MPLFSFGKRPSPAPAPLKPAIQKPTPAPKPKGLFGEKNDYRSFKDLKEFIRKVPDKPVPGYGGKMYKGERLKAMEKLQKYGERYLGRKYGLSPRDLGSVKDPYSIIGKMTEEISKAKREGRWGEVKQLEKDIKTYEQWKGGFK